jgi:hypothetical protein
MSNFFKRSHMARQLEGETWARSAHIPFQHCKHTIVIRNGDATICAECGRPVEMPKLVENPPN